MSASKRCRRTGIVSREVEDRRSETYLIVDIAILRKRITSRVGGTIVGDRIDGSHDGRLTMKSDSTCLQLKLNLRKREGRGSLVLYTQPQAKILPPPFRMIWPRVWFLIRKWIMGVASSSSRDSSRGESLAGC
jgi:hypothetical protein